MKTISEKDGFYFHTHSIIGETVTSTFLIARMLAK
jgi:hypothetical protein